MKTFLLVVFVFLGWSALVAAATANSHNYDYDNYNDALVEYPHVLTVRTTRTLASRLSGVVDILRRDSRRLPDQHSEAVELNVVVATPAEQRALVELFEENEGPDFIQVHEELTARQQQQQQQRHQHQRHAQVRPSGGIDGSEFHLDLSCYRTVEETYASMEVLAELYPDFVTTFSLGESYFGRDIMIMVISVPYTDTPKDQKPPVMLVGGHHSRELPPPEFLMRFAEQLLNDYGSDADTTWIVNRTTLHIVPIANPDGREIVQDHLSWYYRKNAAPQGCFDVVSDGTDLNRNYPMFWGMDSGSSADPCSNTFRGAGPLSEPESNAVHRYFQFIFPPEIRRGDTGPEAMERRHKACPEETPGLFVDLHSWGDFIIFPYTHDDEASPNHVSLLTLASKLAHPGNYTLWGPGQEGFMYFAAGSGTDTTYGIGCVASVAYEIGLLGFYPDCPVFEQLNYPQAQASLFYGLKTASAPFQIPLGPDILNISVTLDDTGIYTIIANVSDDALIVPHAVFPSMSDRSQTIDEVLLYLDDHPDERGAVGIPMLPYDGAFDGVNETAIYQWLPDPDQGSIAYIQATDSDGNVGAVSAVFLTPDGVGPNARSQGAEKASCETMEAVLSNPACCVAGIQCPP